MVGSSSGTQAVATIRAPSPLVTLLEPLGIAVVEDAAHAFPSRVAGPTGRYAGTFGRVGAFSFYATKTITTGEGGMLVTDDDAIAARARTMSLHGISRDAWNRYAASGSWYYETEDAGYKYNMTDIAAALGLVQLERADGAARLPAGSLPPPTSLAWANPPLGDLIEWHNDFGRPRSHGCINLTPQSAKWLYRWTTPVVKPIDQFAFKSKGTRVEIVI